jgi:succinoglycan biosynthesis protein ExoL
VAKRVWASRGFASLPDKISAVLASEPSTDGTTTASGRGGLVAYFGPDLSDSVVRRRVSQWRQAGFKVLPLAFSRSAASKHAAEEFVALGQVMPLSRARRVLPLTLAACRVIARRKMLAGADLFIARNLDIALLALFARWVCGSSAPLIYEVLDINVSCTAPGWRGALVRRAERWVLACADLLVVSSPCFATDYYQARLHYRRPWFLFENKIPKWVSSSLLSKRGPGAAAKGLPSSGKRRWSIGLFGYLDDEKSWDVLRQLAEALPEQVTICVRGTPYTNFDMTRFLADVARLDNVTYGGPYRNPEDLAEVYGAVDIVWSMDFNFPTSNSKWLLTNGLYEAGYFGKPILGLRGTAVGSMIESWRSGWCLDEPVAATVIDFIRGLTVEQYEAKRQEIARLSRDLFVETDEVERIWAMVRNQEARQDASAAPQQIPATR